MLIIDDFTKALGQILDARSVGVVARALVATVILLVLVGVLTLLAITLLVPGTITLPVVGPISAALLASIAAIPALIFGSSFLMFPVAAFVMGFFLDEISSAVDRRHYPHLPTVASLPFGEVMADGAKFAAVFLFANGLALIIYILIAPLAPFIFWIVNGYLIGREYFHQVARRRMPAADATQLRRRFRLRVWFAGILMAVPLSIPVLNLIVPILGIATFTHQVERLRQR